MFLHEALEYGKVTWKRYHDTFSLFDVPHTNYSYATLYDFNVLTGDLHGYRRFMNKAGDAW